MAVTAKVGCYKAILAPSVKGLQDLLNACQKYCDEWDIQLNAQKTKNMFFGKGPVPSHLVKLNGNDIPWVPKWKYLGITLKSGPSFGCCITEKISKYYRALNAILRVEGRSDDKVMLRLLEAHCFPILTYGIEVIHVRRRDDRRKMRVAYNAVFRKLFGYNYWDSVTDLQHSLLRPTWEEMVEDRQLNFWIGCASFQTGSLIQSTVAGVS